MSELSHFDAHGASRMVDVGGKTSRRDGPGERPGPHGTRNAGASPRPPPGQRGCVGSRAAGRHHGREADGRLDPAVPPIRLDAVELHLTFRMQAPSTIEATARVTARTGVEMEALVAVSVAALTIYDMCKAVDRGLQIGRHSTRGKARRTIGPLSPRGE